MPPNAPEHTEGKEEFSQQIEKSIDDRIRELQSIDEQKGEALQQLKRAIVEKMKMPKLDDRGQVTGSKIDDLRLDKGEMGQVFDMLQEDPTVKDLLDQSGLKTPEDFMALLGLSELSSNKLGLQKGPTTINEDTNIFNANGKMLGVIFRGETAQITDATQKMIKGQPHVLAKVTHDLGRFRSKYAGKTKDYTGYIPVSSLQGNAELSAAPEPAPVEPPSVVEPVPAPTPEPSLAAPEPATIPSPETDPIPDSEPAPLPEAAPAPDAAEPEPPQPVEPNDSLDADAAAPEPAPIEAPASKDLLELCTPQIADIGQKIIDGLQPQLPAKYRINPVNGMAPAVKNKLFLRIENKNDSTEANWIIGIHESKGRISIKFDDDTNDSNSKEFTSNDINAAVQHCINAASAQTPDAANPPLEPAPTPEPPPVESEPPSEASPAPEPTSEPVPASAPTPEAQPSPIEAPDSLKNSKAYLSIAQALENSVTFYDGTLQLIATKSSPTESTYNIVHAQADGPPVVVQSVTVRREGEENWIQINRIKYSPGEYSGATSYLTHLLKENADKAEDEPQPAEPSLPEPTPEGSSPSSAEVLQRREQITNYYTEAYDGVCYDYDKAAQEAGFGNRQEADQYLSELTGSKYGPDLKTGDTLVRPDGKKVEYFATAREVVDALATAKDTTSSDALYYSAHAYAQENNQVLNLDGLMNPSVIYAALVRAKVFDMKVGQRLQEPESSVTFEKTAYGIYFNSQTDDNIWGRLDMGSNVFFIKNDGKFIVAEKIEPSVPEGVTAFIADTSEGKRVFDVKGVYSEELTKFLSPDASSPAPTPAPAAADTSVDAADFARLAAEYIDGDTLNEKGRAELRLLNNDPTGTSALRPLYRFKPKITEPITEAEFVAKLKGIKEPDPFVVKGPASRGAPDAAPASPDATPAAPTASANAAPTLVEAQRPAPAEVTEVTAANFDQLLKSENTILVVSGPGCHACEVQEALLAKLAPMFGNQFKVAFIMRVNPKTGDDNPLMDRSPIPRSATEGSPPSTYVLNHGKVAQKFDKYPATFVKDLIPQLEKTLGISATPEQLLQVYMLMAKESPLDLLVGIGKVPKQYKRQLVDIVLQEKHGSEALFEYPGLYLDDKSSPISMSDPYAALLSEPFAEELYLKAAQVSPKAAFGKRGLFTYGNAPFAEKVMRTALAAITVPADKAFCLQMIQKFAPPHLKNIS